MATERPATWEEQQHFANTARILKESFPSVRKGRVDSVKFTATGTTMYRDASGRIVCMDDLDVLSNDSWWSRKKPRQPTNSEMNRWRLLSVTLESGSPALRGTKLISLQIRYGELRISGVDGALNCLVESEPTAINPFPQIDIAPLPETDFIDASIAEYEAERARDPVDPDSPFVAVHEEPTQTWKPPFLRKHAVLRKSE